MEWRVKSYYEPRVLIEVGDVLDSPFPDSLMCLTGAEQNLLRNLCQYLHRTATFVSEYRETDYLAPTEEEWDAIQAIVATMEEKLMGCPELTQLLEDILAAAQCGCESARERAYLGEIPTPPGEQQSPFYYGEGVPDGPMTPAEEQACAVAQCWYQKGYEVITEHVLPASRVGFDILLPAVCGFVALITGGPVAALGYYTVAELIQKLMMGFYDAAETNLINWLESNKDEIVCALYWPLKDGTTAAAAWEVVWTTIVLQAEDISEMDKWIVDLFMGPWAGLNAQAAWNNQTAWALASVTPGYCDDCEEPPIEGDGWYARRLYGEQWTHIITFDNETWCVPAFLFPGETIIGCTFTAMVEGSMGVRRRDRQTGTCDPNNDYTMWPYISGDSWDPNIKRLVMCTGYEIDRGEVVALLYCDLDWSHGDVIARIGDNRAALRFDRFGVDIFVTLDEVVFLAT